MDERDEIRSRVDIVTLVSREVQLKRIGKNYQGLCPFHPDKRPSMTVNPETGRYRCWSCGASGDIFNWVMNRQNVEFIDALKILADDAGVVLSRGAERTDTKSHADTMTFARTFFREQLAQNLVAQDYCKRRGLDAETLEKWQIGYAPDMGEALVMALKKAGHSLVEAKSLFLVDQDPTGGFFDKFRGRLMFPIHNERGHVVAFGGRVIGTGQPKYINSSDTPLFRKSKILYGFFQARESIFRDRRAVLVEGYLDVIACHRAGVTNAVASLGTSATEDQAKLLRRWADAVTVLYDGDDAGQKATDRAIAVFRAEGLRVDVASLAAGDDPDTLLSREGAAAVEAAAQRTAPPVDFKLARLEATRPYSDPAFWDEAYRILAEAENELELDRHVLRLANHYPGIRDPVRAHAAMRNTVLRARRDMRAAARAKADRPDGEMRPGLKPGPARKVHEELHSAEIVILRALLSTTFRQSGWFFSRTTQYFLTGAAIEICQAVHRAFPTAPPQGEAWSWIAVLQPDSVRDSLEAIAHDVRGEHLSETYVKESFERLRRLTLNRRARANADSTEGRAKYIQHLMHLKPRPEDDGSEVPDDW
ncbi:MAG: DNA primase [Fimbriimonadaceae bacterium]|nr:DNA primase [Fimbriimonadaceae bacterium]